MRRPVPLVQLARMYEKTEYFQCLVILEIVITEKLENLVMELVTSIRMTNKTESQARIILALNANTISRSIADSKQN